MWWPAGTRDGIEPPTQAVSGLWLLGPVYFATAKSNFFILKYYHSPPFFVLNSEYTLNTLPNEINAFYEN